AVDDDPVQPGPERSAAIEAVERAQGGEERFLGDVLGGRCVVHDEVCGAVRARPVLAEQGFEVRGGAGPGALHPGSLLTARARHATTLRDRCRWRATGALRAGV